MSAFGNAAASDNSRATATNASASDEGVAKPSATPANASTDEAKGKPAPQPTAKTSGRKHVSRKVGEPFVVETADLKQTSTQTPATQPPSSRTPAQTDATRPPGTEQQQTVPPTARPNPPANPQTPPGTQQPAPQTPPGVQTPPATQPPATTAPNPAPTATTPSSIPPSETTAPNALETQEPNFPSVQRRPVPPLPPLERVGVNSGDSLSLSLNEAIRRALENNNDIEVARNDVRLAEQQLYVLQGVYDPVFTYTPEINNSVRPVTNIFGGAGTAGTVTTTDYNNNATVDKQFGRGGGNFTYFFNNTRETTSASNTSINPFYSSAQGLQFTQPLWRNRSIDRNRQQIRIQRKRLEQSDSDFRLRTIAVISQVQRAYWDLVFALRNEQNQISNVNLARENFRTTEASVSAGASAPLQRAEIETELATREDALLIANQQVTVAENTLKTLMLKDPLSPDWSKVLLPTDEPSFDETPVNLESSLKEARENRPEMRRLKLEEEVNDINLQFYKNQTKPRVDLTGTFQTNGLAGTPNSTLTSTTPSPLILGDSFASTSASAFLLQQLNQTRVALGLQAITNVPTVTPTATGIPSQFVGGYGQTLQNLFSFSTRQIVVGVTIQLPFKNRVAKANLATARIQRDQLAAQTRGQEETVEVDVRNAVQAVETARRRVIFAREASKSAEEQLAGERRLFQVGRSTQFLLFQRENALVNARNQELQAETDYNKALSDLQRATSTTLRANNIIVDSPVPPEKFKD
ncbi:MAG TPA: TolC family protein [Pyrinomonadaceae bacterium]|nr:TolC family protein [Pyrinomonadaceae bacterium]